jgi:hypothetical protein
MLFGRELRCGYQPLTDLQVVYDIVCAKDTREALVQALLKSLVAEELDS